MNCDELSIKLMTLYCPHTSHIVNHFLAESVVPSLWREAIVEKKTNPLEYKNLRASQTLFKVLERAMKMQIKNNLTNFLLLSSMQSEFRTLYSSSSALPHILDDIVLAFNQSKYTLLVLLDFNQAFDT